jgi:hypothetical protein
MSLGQLTIVHKSEFNDLEIKLKREFYKQKFKFRINILVIGEIAVDVYEDRVLIIRQSERKEQMRTCKIYVVVISHIAVKSASLCQPLQMAEGPG